MPTTEMSDHTMAALLAQECGTLRAKLETAEKALIGEQGIDEYYRGIVADDADRINALEATLKRIEPLPDKWVDRGEYTMPRDVCAAVRECADDLIQAMKDNP